jgi:hypothetical protein
MRVISGIVRGQPVFIGHCAAATLPTHQSIFSLPIPDGSGVEPNIADIWNRVWFTCVTLRRRGEEERVIVSGEAQAALLPGWEPMRDRLGGGKE